MKELLLVGPVTPVRGTSPGSLFNMVLMLPRQARFSSSTPHHESIKFLLDEMGHGVRMVGPRGWNMVEGITTLSNWRDLPGHCDSLRWARERLD
jgi:hypothetical protein